MQIVSNVALISINETLFIQLISFLIFLYLINRLMYRPLMEVMEERESYISKLQEDIRSAGVRLEDISKDLTKKESAVRSEALHICRSLEDEGSTEASQVLSEVRGRILEMKRTQEQEVRDQLQKAREDLQSQSEALALQIMETILERRLAS